MRIAAILILGMASATAVAQKPIGEVRATDASVKGSVVLGKDGAIVMSGAQVTAGSLTAQVKLARGGEVDICAGSAVALSSSANGEDLMYAMNSGALETHYKLGARSDAIMTPDFRIQLSGPGTFHLAVSIRASGETCVESLPGNGSAAIITEVFGDATYQLQTGKSVIFKNGHVDGVEEKTSPGCGCPPAAAEPPAPHFDPGLKFPEDESKKAATLVAEGKPLPDPHMSTPIEQAQTGKVYTKVDAPIVYSPEAAAIPAKTVIQPANAPQMPTDTAPKVTTPPVVPVQPPAANPQQKDKGQPEPKKKWYQRLGAAFAKIFK